MKLSEQNEPTAEFTPGKDRAMDGLLHEYASQQTTDDEDFLSALESALDKDGGAPITEPIVAQKSGRRLWKWGLAGSAAACAVGMLVWRESQSKELETTVKSPPKDEPQIAAAVPEPEPRFEVKENLTATVDDVISIYEKVAGVTVVRTGHIKGIVPIKGSQSVKMNKAEIVAYYKAALLEKGLSMHEYSPKLHALTLFAHATPLYSASPSVASSTSSVTPGVGGTSTPSVQYMPYVGPVFQGNATVTPTNGVLFWAEPTVDTNAKSIQFNARVSNRTLLPDRVVRGPVQFGSLASGASTSYSWAQLLFNPTDPTDRPDLQSSADKYNPAIENPFLSPLKAPLSTFSVDVDTASYANLRRMIQEGRAVPPAAVRIEEMVNYFTYDYPQPDGAHPFSVSLETASCPWAPTHRLVKIGLKAKEIAKEKRPSANLVFLCDVSGSMNSPDRLPLLVENLKVLTNELNADDTVGIVVYAGNQGVALPPTSGGDKDAILKVLSNLSAGGSTNGGAGITRAYEMAQERFVKGGINRVVLCTDGDFNVGTTSNEALVNLVKEKAAGGVFLTVCGYGRGNLNDAMLESITNKGNGVYHYVDSEKEGKKIFKDELFGTLMTVAKDVKLQVEFNPGNVGSYRLVGYDNRMLKKEDFANDKVDAGDIGSGHSVTALYEVIPPGVDEPQKPADDLKYQKGIMPTSTNQEPHIVKHADGGMTKSVYDAEKKRIVEDRLDANQQLVTRKIFQMDATGRLANGIITDAKGNAIGSLKYGYDKNGEINEERLYNNKGQCIQRKFPPGKLPTVPENARSTVIFKVDPQQDLNSINLASSAMTVVDSAEESFPPTAPTTPQPKRIILAQKTTFSPELLTVKLRYKEPEGTESKLLEVPHTDAGQMLAAASSDFKFASAVAEFGERLRGKRSEGRNPAMILEQAEAARGNDPHGLRGEFLELVKKGMTRME